MKKLFLGIFIIVIACTGLVLLVVFNSTYVPNGTIISNDKMEYLESQQYIEMHIIQYDEASGLLYMKFINNTEHWHEFGAFFNLYKKDTGLWRHVPFPCDVFFPLLGYIITSYSYREHTTNLRGIFGDLPDGEYAIIRDVGRFDTCPDNDFPVVGRFIIQS